MNEKKIRPFSILDEIGYVCGDCAGSFVNLFVDAYFLTFCTYVLGISAGWMGTLFIVARLWDAFNDPMIGSFPDRWTIGKSGNKFKPWIKIFMIPLALSGVLCFMDVPFEGVALHAWVAFVYILYGMSYTGTSMPFGAMANVVTTDPMNRSKLSRARSLGGTFVGMGALSIVPVFCFDSDNNIIPERFFILAVIFGVCSIVCYILLMNLTQERVKETSAKDKGEKYSLMDAVKLTLKNRPMLGVMFATIGSMLYVTGVQQSRSYVYIEYYQNTSIMTAISIVSIPIIVVLFPIVPRLTARLGKKKALIWSVLTSTVFSCITFFIRIPNVYAYTALLILGMVGQTVFTMTIWSLVTDCIDYSDWKFDKRYDGSMYSIYTFSRKIGSTVASAVVSFGLGAIGYVSGSNIAQSVATVDGIYTLVNLLPLATCIVELIGIGLIFNLDKKETETMYKELADKRAARGQEA